MKIVIALLFIALSFSANGQTTNITTICGTGVAISGGDNGPAISATITANAGGIFDKFGNYYFVEGPGNRVRKITTSGTIVACIGTGALGYSGDGGPATAATLRYPKGIAVDTLGNLYVADGANHRIRKVDAATGIITTIAGNGMTTNSGDGGLATIASFDIPVGLAIDKSGNIYFSDQTYSVIRKISSSGIVSTIAGIPGVNGLNGDGGPASLAELTSIEMLRCDNVGNVYMVGFNVRKINVLTGIISKVAGVDVAGYGGDGGPAINASLFSPIAIGFDVHENLFIADTKNNRIRKIDAITGIITTIAGTGIAGFNGDGQPAMVTQMYWPEGIAFDSCGDLYFNDLGNNRIRKIDLSVCGSTGIDNILHQSFLSVFPNPANNELTITAPEEIKSVSVVDMVGRETSPGLSEGEVSLPVRQTGSNERNVRVDVSHLPAGVYVVRVNGIYFRKFVKE